MKRKRPSEPPINGTREGDSEPIEPFSKVDEATLKYYQELKGHIGEISDEEQRGILASNALAEGKGKIKIYFECEF